MKVAELVKALRQADPKAEVEICLEADYYAVDSEFTGSAARTSGPPVFVIEAEKPAAEDSPPPTRASCCEQIHVVPGDDGQGVQSPPCGKPARWLLGDEPVCDACRREYLGHPHWTEEDFKPLEAHAHAHV